MKQEMKKEMMKEESYMTNCVFCGCRFKTIKGTANEGICYSCRCV